MGVLTTINGIQGYAISLDEFEEFGRLIDVVRLAPTVLNCSGYYEAIRIYERWAGFWDRITRGGSESYDMSRGYFNMVMVGEEYQDLAMTIFARQQLDSEVMDLQESVPEGNDPFVAFAMPSFPQDINRLRVLAPKIGVGLCPGRVSGAAFIVAALGLGAVGLTGWGVARASKKRNRRG